MTAPRFEIRRSRIGRRRYRVVLIGAQGEPLNTSEHLNSKAACHTNIAAVREAVAFHHAPVIDTTRTR